ncbi:hypothetical protein CSUI_009721 [Cystoisospora suis]|uniref:Uncharacterized protein n=1 Tax=Cystoisospora suis TaxID=483139 RepID=A0A2C6KJ91_9APIC|nr:hypothetical protein CSUI_009721 [Cystoisospora suis]
MSRQCNRRSLVKRATARERNLVEQPVGWITGCTPQLGRRVLPIYRRLLRARLP